MENVTTSPSAEPGWLNWINQRPRLVLCGCVCLLALQTSSLHYPSRDGVLYLSFARSLLRGEKPALLGAPSIYIPPFYSLAISPFFYVSDRPFLFLSLSELCLASLLLWGVYRWAKTACPRGAVLLACMVVLNQSVLVYSRRTLKETLFMVLVVWAGNLSHDLLAARGGRVRMLMTALGLSLLMCALALTRYVALIFPVILAGGLLLQVLQRSRGFLQATLLAGVVAAPAAAAVFFWVTRGMDYQKDGHHIAALLPYTAPPQEPAPVAAVNLPQLAATAAGGIVTPAVSPAPAVVTAPDPTLGGKLPPIHIRWRLLLDGLRFRVSDISRLLVPGMWKAPPLGFDGMPFALWFVYLPVAAVCALGWFRLVRQRLDVLVCAVPLWIGIYIHATADAYGRLLNPLLPVLGACLYLGLRTFCSDRRAFAALGVLLAGNLAQATGYWLMIDRPRAIQAVHEMPTIEQLAGFLRSNPQPVAISDQIDQAFWLSLVFVLDRDVQHPAAVRGNEPKPRWFISRRSQAAEPGVAARFSADDYMITEVQNTSIATVPVATH